jgi:hypothetical protein
MHVNVNRGWGEEVVGDAGAYGDAFRNACCRKAATKLADPNVDRETVGGAGRHPPVQIRAAVTIAFDSFGGLAFATSGFSRSSCALKARGQEILAGIILPPKDRALKATARLGLRPDRTKLVHRILTSQF